MDRPGENVQTVGGIPEEDFRAAIEASCRNPVFSRYLEDAPAGARRFIGLQFYMAVYPDRVDGPKYRQCLAELEPGLGVGDIDYVLPRTNDQAAKAYLQQLRDRLVPLAAPPLQRVEEILPRSATVRVPRPQPPPPDPVPRKEPPAGKEPSVPRKEGPAPQEYGRPVMSEYERQKRAFRREQRLTGLWRAVKLLLVVAVLAVVGYLAFALNMSGIEAKVNAARPKLEGLRADKALLTARLAQVGYGKGRPSEIERMKIFKKLLEDSAFRELELRYLGETSRASTPHLVDCFARQINLEEEKVLASRRLTMLKKTLSGRMTEDSPSYRADIDRAVNKLEDVEKRISRSWATRSSALTNTIEKVGGILSTIAARMDALAEQETLLEEARELRRSVFSWVFPADDASR